MTENKSLEQELAEAAGETHYRSVRPLELNELSLNGDADAEEIDGKLVRKGGYFRKRVYAGHRDRNSKPKEENLGAPIKIVFLRKRRKLVERGDEGKIVRQTNEHNHPGDVVSLYHAATQSSEHGIASDLRKRYEGLRTVEIVYALLIDGDETELVRFSVKGSSLGSKAKADTTTDLYSYMGSYTPDEHLWQYYTILTPVLEKGLKSYFAIDFKRGEELDGEFVRDIVAPALLRVAENIKGVDRSRHEKIADAASKAAEPAEPQGGAHEEAGDEYPKDDINPDDIPF